MFDHLRWRMDGAIATWRRARLARAAAALLPDLPTASEAEPWRLLLLEDGRFIFADPPTWASAHLRLTLLSALPRLRRKVRRAWRSGTRFLDIFPPNEKGRRAVVWVGDPARVRGVFQSRPA
jgi:hypothetical protein